MALKEYAGNAKETRLSSSLAVGTTTNFTVATGGGAGYPSGATAPFVVVIDPDSELEEKILVGSRAGDVFSTLTRAYDGTTAQEHAAQAKVEHVWDAASATEASQHVNDDARDDHSQYLNASRHSDVLHTAAMIDPGAITTESIEEEAITYALLSEDQRWEPGDIKMTARSVAATGWLMCNGAAVSRATYADLFAAIGTTHGAGDGTTTFNLPDFRRTFPLGKADSGTGSTLGGSGGSNNAAVVSHNHTQDSHDHTQDAHNHTQDAHGHSADDNHIGTHAHAIDGDYGNRIAVTVIDGAHRIPVDTGQAGQDVSFSDIDDDGAHNHDITVNGNTATNQATTANNQATTATNQGTGVSATDANMPQFRVLNFMVKT